MHLYYISRRPYSNRRKNMYWPYFISYSLFITLYNFFPLSLSLSFHLIIKYRTKKKITCCDSLEFPGFLGLCWMIFVGRILCIYSTLAVYKFSSRIIHCKPRNPKSIGVKHSLIVFIFRLVQLTFGLPDPDPLLFSTDSDPDPTCYNGYIYNNFQQIKAAKNLNDGI